MATPVRHPLLPAMTPLLKARERDRRHSFLWHELWWCLWNVLAYEHDDMVAEADAARRNAADCADAFRAYSDPLDGPEASDLFVIWAWEMAREGFLSNLKWERSELEDCQSDWLRERVRARLNECGWRSGRGHPRRHRRHQEYTSRSPIGPVAG